MSMVLAAPRPTRRQPWGVIVLLALAIACAGLSIWASERKAAIQGPSTLGLLPDGAAWLLVDDALWGLDAAGHRLHRVPVGQTGLASSPAVLTYRRSTQELYAITRDGTRVAVLHPRTAQPIRTLALAWPPDLLDSLGGAVWLAVHNDGRMAVATGKGHTVVLFAPDGEFLQRTPPGRYRYTNELWWEGDALWTTDTNGHALVRLDGQTLAEQQRVALNDEDALRYTALAKAHPHAGVARTAPRATVARLDGRMDTGRVVHVWDDGREDSLDLGAGARPLELGWSNDTLFIVDGRDWRVRRFDSLNQPLPDFGDAQVRQDLADLHIARDRWDRTHHVSLWAAIGAALTGALWFAWFERRRLVSPEAALEVARFLGTPVLPRNAWLRRAAVVFAPLGALMLWMLLIRLVLSPAVMGLSTGRMTVMAALATSVTVAALLAWWGTWWLRRQARQEAAEAVLNVVPVRWLMRSDDWQRVAVPGEHVRETWLLRHLWRPRWLILTNQRLLVFTARARARRLVLEVPRREVVRVSLRERGTLRWWERLVCQAQLTGVMRIALRDGTVLEGGLSSWTLARRVQAQLILLKKPDHAPAASQLPQEAAG